jgi:glycosyltransferase involved in cell wall biosynthesis
VLRRARALLMPSRWQEPFGIVGLEALTLGVPVVAWEGGGVAEWHPGGPSLVPWGDVDGLAAALRAAVDGPRASAPIGFEPRTLMERLVAIYDALRTGAEMPRW